MENCSKDECCSTKHDTCHEQESDECGHADFFLEIADCAWTEVLKDKIKEYILATQKDRMTALAKIVAEGNSKRWKNKMEGKNNCAEFEEEICRFFSQNK